MSNAESLKNVIVTGANTGIGFNTARALAQQNYRVIMACRSLESGMEARKLIAGEFGGSGSRLDVMMLDLADLNSVREFAREYMKKYTELSILINNAGLTTPEYTTTAQGVELTIGVNFLGHFYLSNLLIPALMKGQPSRIIFLTSYLHSLYEYNFEDAFNSKSGGGGTIWSVKQYSYSKTANILNMVGLLKVFRRNKINPSQISVNCVHPGSVLTRLGRNYNSLVMFGINVVTRIIGVTPDVGCQTVVRAATSPSLNGITGNYYREYKLDQPKAWAICEQNAIQLWKYATNIIIELFKSADNAYLSSDIAEWIVSI